MQISFTSINPALIISTLALLFTISSFWWIHRRPGRLIVFQPRSTELWRSTDSRVAQFIVLPLVFFNKGAMPVIIQNIRLVPKDEGSSQPFTFQHLVKGLDNGEYEIATQFPVRGGEALLRHVQFMRIPADITWEARTYVFRLEVVLGNRSRWRHCINVTLPIHPDDVLHVNQHRSWLIDNMRKVH